MAKLPFPRQRGDHPLIGLINCLGLAFWVDPTIWIVGIGLIGAGLVWHVLARPRLDATRE